MFLFISACPLALSLTSLFMSTGFSLTPLSFPPFIVLCTDPPHMCVCVCARACVYVRMLSSNPCTDLSQAQRVPGGWGSTDFETFGTWQLHQLPLPPGKYSWYSFQLEAGSTPSPLFGWKDYIGNRTHDLLACSTVPQPTAPPTMCICISFFIQVMPSSIHGLDHIFCTHTVLHRPWWWIQLPAVCLSATSLHWYGLLGYVSMYSGW